MKYYGIEYKRMICYGNCSSKYIICTVPHKVEDHSCIILGCNKGKVDIYIHITAKCANRGEDQIANSLCCRSKHKTDIEATQSKMVISKKEEA